MTSASRFLKSSLIVVLFVAAGCKESRHSAPPGEQASSPAPTTPHGAHAHEGDDAIAANLNQVLASYERLRALLADDQLAEISAAAADLKRAAQGTAGKAPAALDEQVRAITTAAGALTTTSTDDEAALRRAFGDLSRPVVALIAADPKLAEGRHLFECPMAEGYKRWVQTNDHVANPYMGKQMSSCGSAAPWR